MLESRQERDGLRTFQKHFHTNKGSLYPSPLEDILCRLMLIKEDRILHQWRFPLVVSLKQAHINLDEYNDEDYVNFDMIDETL